MHILTCTYSTYMIHTYMIHYIHDTCIYICIWFRIPESIIFHLQVPLHGKGHHDGGHVVNLHSEHEICLVGLRVKPLTKRGASQKTIENEYHICITPKIDSLKMFLFLKGTYLASKPVFGGITYVPQFMLQPFKWYPPGKENISHPWERKIIFNTAFPGDMLVPRRVFSSVFFIIWTCGLLDLLWQSAKRLTKWTTAHWRHILHCKGENLHELYICTC